MIKTKYPWGPMEVQVLTAGANVAATVDVPTIIQIGAAALAAAATLNLTVGKSCQAGTELYITWLNGTTKRDVTPGTGFKGTEAITGVASSTVTAKAVYDGTAFHIVSERAQ